MASHDYYNNYNKPLPEPSPSPQPSNYDTYPPYASSGPSNPPSYSSQQHLGSYDRPSPNAAGTTASPFDTVFDDHVYPANSRQTPSSSQHQLLSQQDTAYHSLAQAPEEDMAYNHPADDIPLQNQSRNSVKDSEMQDMQDHVYDAPQGRRKARKVRFGELGMLGANNRNRIPWVVYLFTIVQVGVFIGEIVKNATLTGSPIEIQPSFNPMIGPSPYVLINMGSRFVPCMHNTDGVQSSTEVISWPCPNTTTNDATSPSQHCTLSDLCGFGGVPEPDYNGNANQNPQPNQWFRFIVPMFMHAGVIHIGFNLLLQLTMAKEMEKSIGSIRFFLVYVCAGIFGFVMGGNFAATGISSTGASGSLFGIIALTLLDLFYSWKDRASPVKDLMFILLDVVISFVLGLLPGLDNFSHIGGFLMGLALGICVLHSPNALRRRIGVDTPYSSVSKGPQNQFDDGPSFFANPIGFFQGRRPLWWAWWFIRLGALVLVTIVFILLLNNFYIYHNTCGWCKYLSCLPVNNWCEVGNLQLSSQSNSKRDVLVGGLQEMARLYIE